MCRLLCTPDSERARVQTSKREGDLLVHTTLCSALLLDMQLGANRIQIRLTSYTACCNRRTRKCANSRTQTQNSTHSAQHTHIHIHTHMHTHIHSYIKTRTHSLMRAYTHMRSRTRAHTHAQLVSVGCGPLPISGSPCLAMSISIFHSVSQRQSKVLVCNE